MNKVDAAKIAINKELRKKSIPVLHSGATSVTEEAYFSRKNKELVDKLKKKKA